jgi:CBS domain-containing protein
MTTFTHSLKPLALPASATVRQPARAALEHVTMDSPALGVMTDLRRSRAVTIAPDTPVPTALTVMIHANVRLLVVLGSAGLIGGLVSARDLGGEEPLRIAARERIAHDAVRVAQVMTPVAAMQPLDLHDVEHASVRDVVRHLVETRRQHVLVLERLGPDEYAACGLFSATQIGRQLGHELVLDDGRAQSFSELERLLG